MNCLLYPTLLGTQYYKIKCSKFDCNDLLLTFNDEIKTLIKKQTKKIKA